MEFVSRFLNEHGSSIAMELAPRMGVEPERAERFVRAAVERLVASVSEGKLDPAALLGGNTAALSSSVDGAELAGEVGLDRDQVETGLASIAPKLVEALRSQGGGVDGVLSLLGRGQGDLLGGAAKLAGGFFRKP